MRPQDIIVLLKIVLLSNKRQEWQYRDLAAELYISTSEISASIKRNQIAGLLDESRKNVFRRSFMEFLQYGVRYVFPQLSGTIVTGVGTAHSHPYFKSKIVSEIDYVWPAEQGNIRGLLIEPLHKNVVAASKNDEQLYLLLASIDILRVGKARERKIAIQLLEKAIL